MDLVGSKTVRDLWNEQAELRNDETFLVFEDSEGNQLEYSYGEFNAVIDSTARALHEELGVDKGDKVAIHLRNSPAYLQTWFALLKLGAVTVHSNVLHTPREVNYTLANSDARVAITEPAFAEVVSEAKQDTPVETVVFARAEDQDEYADEVLLEELADSAEADLPQTPVAGDDTAQILFTSGTTSDPKGVIHTHTNLVWSGERISKSVAMRPSDVMGSILPLFHVNGQSVSVLSTLTVGGRLVLFEEYETSKFMDQLRRHGATLTSIVGTQVRALLATPEQPEDGDNDLREIFFALNVTEKQKEAFEHRFDVTLINGYGLTETATGVSIAPLYGERRYPSIGRPQFERDVYLVDDNGDPVETGERGEIAVDGIRGRTIFKEYYEMPGKTEEAFTDQGWFLTGDIGRFDEDGYLYFVDRKKNIIETRGENVSEAEVEKVLEKHGKVGDVGVIGISHELYGEAPKAYVLPLDPSLSEEELDEYAAENLAEFKIPVEYEFVEEFPRTSIGKIEKKTLREQERKQEAD